MDDPKINAQRIAIIIRWTARALSIASIGFVLVILVGEFIFPHAAAVFTLRDLVLLLFFPLGTCAGMVLAWRWEGLGGAITVGSVLAFYAAMRVMDGRFPRGPYFALIAAPGVLFLLSWVITASKTKESRST